MKKLPFDYSGPFLKHLGRGYLDSQNKAYFFTFSASGFEVRFSGTSLEAEIISNCNGQKDGKGYLAVVIDDESFFESHKIPLDEPKAVYSLVSGLKFGIHRVRVYKRTEASCSYTAYRYIATDGTFMEVDDSPRLKIEFYGDSITAGNGDEGVKGDDVFETRTENAITSYGALSAESLNADFSIIAIGGFPLFISPWNTGEIIKTIPDMMSFSDFRWGMRKEDSIPWDHQKFIPDIVVINLGTNDDQYCAALPLEEEKTLFKKDFEEAYLSFISKIAALYPNAKIIIGIGMIKNSYLDYVISKVAKEAPSHPSFIKFDSLRIGGYMANGGHPNKAMHLEAAQELTNLIKSLTSSKMK